MKIQELMETTVDLPLKRENTTYELENRRSGLWNEPNPNMDWIDYIRRDKCENFGMTKDCYDFIRDVHDNRNLLSGRVLSRTIATNATY